MKKIYVEIADTPLKRSFGLMDRHYLNKNHGMLFKFPKKQQLSFWMQSTYVPLDIAFLDDHGKILQIESMVPLSTKVVMSHIPCQMALEVNKGWFYNNDVKVGSYIWGEGITRNKGRSVKMAQWLGFDPLEAPQVDMEIPTGELPQDQNQNQWQQQQQEQEQQPPNLELEIANDFKRILALAQRYGLDLLMVYYKEGLTLPPRTISPFNGEYALEITPLGNEVVRVWDNTPFTEGPTFTVEGPGEKTFLLNNGEEGQIMSLQFKPEDENFLREMKEIP